MFAGGGRNNTCPRSLPGPGVRSCEACRVSTRSRVVVPALLAALLTGPTLLSGCGGDDATEPAAASGSATQNGDSPATPSPHGDGVTVDDGATDAPAFPVDAEADTADPSSDAQVTVSDIRIGRHDGFDRVVFEVGGTGTPGWDVRYVDQASSQGSGEAVEVAGDAVLQVTLTGVGYPYDTGVEEFSGGPVSAAGTRSVSEVVFDATFEGTTVAFVGTSARSPFRVYLLEGPARVVLEVADEG
jgi:hypothetical protein